MTVRLRGHHLLCLLTYASKGYSPAFVANADAVADRVFDGEAIRIVEGADDICAPLLGTTGHHCDGRTAERRDRLALADIGVYLGRRLAVGAVLQPDADERRALAQAFAAGRVRAACANCVWQRHCGLVARRAFAGTRWNGREKPRP
ncbi:DUF1284 domain-containing protein [Minwuia thermotolerans]|uniref:DUF1284 domain-containing protein n=1 Tax=Minwuia thermotolerans TaxID=2056226 RepID=A0A2M9G5V8_9PROT|nr:DUF1284 domain-containing protein [Minwuia thermotolerans]PJK31090.1 DUF1284 domain-containing protein [Minwuia thermotolerans]